MRVNFLTCRAQRAAHADLTRTVETLVRGFQGPLAPALAGLVGEMSDDAILARTIRKEVLGRRRRSIRAACERGIARGEMRADTNLELFMDMLTAPFYFRALFGHVKLSSAMIETVVDTLLTRATSGRIPGESILLPAP